MFIPEMYLLALFYFHIGTRAHKLTHSNTHSYTHAPPCMADIITWIRLCVYNIYIYEMKRCYRFVLFLLKAILLFFKVHQPNRYTWYIKYIHMYSFICLSVVTELFVFEGKAKQQQKRASNFSRHTAKIILFTFRMWFCTRMFSVFLFSRFEIHIPSIRAYEYVIVE